MSSSSSGDEGTFLKKIPAHVLRKFVSSSSSLADTDNVQDSSSDSSEEQQQVGGASNEKPYDADADLFASENEDLYAERTFSDSHSTDTFFPSPEETPVQVT